MKSIYDLEDLKKDDEKFESFRIFQLDLISIITEAFAELSEYKDEDTGYHIKRVAKYSELMANALKRSGRYEALLTDQFIEIIKITSPLHDIGKVMVPDAILAKKGKLTTDEFEVIKKHAQSGGNILKNLHEKFKFYEIDYFLIASRIAENHHEKYDGSGYPKGVSGSEIPIEAQIVSLVDVFDALTSRRPYKPPFTFEMSVDIIVKGRGKHFSPELIDAFLSVLPDFRRYQLLLMDDLYET